MLPVLNMLTVDLRRLEAGGIRLEAEVLAEDALWQDADVTFLRPFRAHLWAVRTGEHSVLVRGRFDAQVRAACRRCLAPLALEIDEPVELYFEPLASPDEEDLHVYHLDALATELDLGWPLREQFLLALPGYPLCREDCRGLCAGCGADLNVETCRCSGKSADPRWGPLRALGSEA